MNTQTAKALMTREFIDNRMAFFTIPAIISAILLAALVAFSISVQFGDQTIQFEDGERIEGLGMLLDHLGDVEVEHRREIITGGMFAFVMPVILILPFIILFSLLSSLYDDRRNRSILFWKSMPVADATEVASKFTASVVMAPAILIGFALVLQVAYLFVASIIVIAHGGSPWALILGPAQPVSTWFFAVGQYFLWALWALPVLGWLMIVSAAAPKAPLLFALVVPFVVALLEELAFDTNHFFFWIVNRVGGFHAKIGDPSIWDKEGDIGVNLVLAHDLATRFGDTLVTADFWFGTLIAAGLFWGAIQLRRFYR